jgi:hypothetical protein
MSNIAMPWSVKGVSDEARARAKALAQASGQTMGVWLSDMILSMESGDEHAPPSHTSSQQNVSGRLSAPVNGHHHAATDPKVSELAELMLALARRVATLEKDTTEFAASFQDQLSDLRYRLRRSEQATAIPATVTSRLVTEGQASNPFWEQGANS